jgi:DNA-binding transcriptional MerR regulator
MEHYTLKDLEKLTGIKADTIRIWERRYGLTSPHRTNTRRRWYTGDDLKKLINVAILKRTGYKILSISDMPVDLLEKTASGLSEKKSTSDIFIKLLMIAMTDLDEAALNGIILKSVIHQGFERTISSVVFPFLHKVGVLWHTSAISIGTEHFVSDFFRRRLITAFDNLSPSLKPGGAKVLMFLPENEYHELGLLYYAYLIRSRGNQVLNLGQSTPLRAAAEISEKWAPGIIITGTLTAIPYNDPEKFIDELIDSFPGKKIILAGALSHAAERKRSKGVFACRSEKDLRTLIRKYGVYEF